MRNSLIAVALAVSCLASISVAQTEPQYRDLPNFHQVSEKLYRGAQPDHGGIRRLSELGIKTIINLRADDERSRTEEQEARAAGLRYFNVPFGRLGKPTDEQVKHVLALITAPENGRVFVHCKRGADRTGIVIAIFRIEHDGWTSEQAKAEASRYGMGLWQQGMKDYIHDYYQRRSERQK
jgi:tyrosine-protein phosphatase SIW14